MSNNCLCINSARDLKTTEQESDPLEGCIDTCPLKSRGPHAVLRKKYKPDDLNTTGFQCNYEPSAKSQDKTHTMDIQCDIQSEEEETESVCAMCRCTTGFCNPRCEKNKQKVGQIRSDSWRASKGSAIPVPIKRKSAPGLASLVADTNTTCKCVGRCTRECEKQKLMQAMAAMKADKIGMQSKLVTKCQKNQCHSGCNTAIQTDMEEPPIGPLAPVPMTNAVETVQPQMEASNICIACQCTGPCSAQCLVKKEKISHLFTPEDMNISSKEVGICKVCDCTDGCTEECMNTHNKHSLTSTETCTCPWECLGQKKTGVTKDNQTDTVAQVCHCETMCNYECDQFKDTQTTVPPQVNQGVACNICKCVGVCNEACKLVHKAETTENALKHATTTLDEQKGTTDNVNHTNPICTTCICPKPCNDECEAAKLEETGRICEECICNATCLPKCKKEMQKKESACRICKDCMCCGTCTKECRENKDNRRMSKSTLNNNDNNKPTPSTPIENNNTKPTNTTEDTTQVKGVIENFNDTDLIKQSKTESVPSNTKAKSTCNIPNQPICDPCQCTDTCQTKCAAIRKIKSVSDYPPNNTVCDECKCIDKCTAPCELKRAKATCLTDKGQPIICNQPNNDWIPCASCKDGIPCSPECRERLAIATIMPKPPDFKEDNAIQCSEPIITCAAIAQTKELLVVSCNVQTSNTTDTAVMKSTSTPNGLISSADVEADEHIYPPILTLQESTAPSHAKPCEDKCPAEPNNQIPMSSQDCCSMCVKLRGYICSMFHSEGQSAEERKSNKCNTDKKNSNLSNDNITRTCLHPQQKCKITSQLQKPRNYEDERPCKCSRSLSNKKGSYTDRMQDMMTYLQASCEDAELAATPFIKAQSVFTLDLSNQQEAIASLLHKCKQKDQYIDAMIADLLDRSKSRVFDGLFSKLQENNSNVPDFDSTLITSALDKKNCNAPVCGIDLMNFKVTSAKRVGPTTLLVKWNKPADGRIVGYDINVNGLMKIKIDKKDTTYAILDALDFSCTISIEVFARAPNGRAYPSALAYYAKY